MEWRDREERDELKQLQEMSNVSHNLWWVSPFAAKVNPWLWPIPQPVVEGERWQHSQCRHNTHHSLTHSQLSFSFIFSLYFPGKYQIHFPGKMVTWWLFEEFISGPIPSPHLLGWDLGDNNFFQPRFWFWFWFFLIMILLISVLMVLVASALRKVCIQKLSITFKIYWIHQFFM